MRESFWIKASFRAKNFLLKANFLIYSRLWEEILDGKLGKHANIGGGFLGRNGANQREGL